LDPTSDLQLEIKSCRALRVLPAVLIPIVPSAEFG